MEIREARRAYFCGAQATSEPEVMELGGGVHSCRAKWRGSLLKGSLLGGITMEGGCSMEGSSITLESVFGCIRISFG